MSVVLLVKFIIPNISVILETTRYLFYDYIIILASDFFEPKNLKNNLTMQGYFYLGG